MHDGQNSPINEELFVPDRFEALQEYGRAELKTIILQLPLALAEIKLREQQMRASRRGGFLLLRGQSGSGKSTFLNTINLFIEGAETVSVSRDKSLDSEFRGMEATATTLRIVTLEGRDALRDVSESDLESAIHSINAFIRSPKGLRTLVVWPMNADDLQAKLIEVSRRVGADSLLGVASPVYLFDGPPQAEFVPIASKTVMALNSGASLHDLGVSDEQASELAKLAPTVGSYLGLIRNELIKNEARIRHLQDTDQSKLWIVIAAGNDPEGDIAGLTQGTQSRADIDRLMSATGANVVAELRKYPERLGILAHMLDVRVLHLPVTTALAIARDFGHHGKLHGLMEDKGLSTTATNDAISRITQCDLGRAFQRSTMGTRTRGPKVGPTTIERFEKLCEIASKDDGAINHAIAEALKASALISSYQLEAALADVRFSDILASAFDLGPIRIEMMWRRSAGRADIANYSLGKINAYAKAIGLID